MAWLQFLSRQRWKGLGFLDRFSFQFAIDVGVFHKVGKLAGDFLILIIAIGAKSFITFFAILAS